MSSRTAKIIIAAIVALAFASFAAGRMHWDRAWFWLAVPPFVLSGWLALGHLITIDDDAPGGFFNAEESKAVWRRSVCELALKMALFAFVIVVFSGAA